MSRVRHTLYTVLAVAIHGLLMTYFFDQCLPERAPAPARGSLAQQP